MLEKEKPQSLAQADVAVLDWVRTVITDSDVHLAPPDTQRNRMGIYVYLMALTEDPPLRGSGRAPLQIEAQYLITVQDTDPAMAHQRLDRLIFDALRQPIFEVTFTALTPQLWSAFNLIPQPAFVLCLSIAVEQPLPAVPIVLEPPSLEGVPMTTLRGVLLGPGEIPLANASVEYPSLQRKVQTNARGEFNLRAVPLAPQQKALRIIAKGKTFEIVVEQPDQPDENIQIHLPLLA